MCVDNAIIAVCGDFNRDVRIGHSAARRKRLLWRGRFNFVRLGQSVGVGIHHGEELACSVLVQFSDDNRRVRDGNGVSCGCRLNN